MVCLRDFYNTFLLIRKPMSSGNKAEQKKAEDEEKEDEDPGKPGFVGDVLNVEAPEGAMDVGFI